MSLKDVQRCLVFLLVFFSSSWYQKHFIETMHPHWETSLPPSVQQRSSLNPAVAFTASRAGKASTQRSRHAREDIGVLGWAWRWLWDGGLSARRGGFTDILTHPQRDTLTLRGTTDAAHPQVHRKSLITGKSYCATPPPAARRKVVRPHVHIHTLENKM